MRRPISLKFKDSEGKDITRSSGLDFESLPTRHINILSTIPGLDNDEELGIWLGTAMDAYNGGWYRKALKYLDMSLERLPELEPYIFYYIRVCKRVLSIPLTEAEKQYEVEFDRYISRIRSLPKWLRWIVPRMEILLRCKWCGRYTQYIDPNTPTYGFSTSSNCCSSCDAMYPMPSWMWDSPDGRSYSYYRMSFSPENKQFYNDFLKDYNPNPTVEKSGLFVKTT